MSYRDPEGADLPVEHPNVVPGAPETDPVGPDDLPGSEDDEDGEEYVPFDPETDVSGEPAERPGETNPDDPGTPGADQPRRDR